ncbi:MFS transporter [Bacillus pinisoli]|uniref:MFS transporter n=1 Tax=Bacillus pinisoli TaxID=2901866 RepID=UPI001FF1C4C9|nr:MFS transporter [Bacillus pinisoli]
MSVVSTKQNINIQAGEKSKTTYSILFILSLGHLLNDTLQSVVPAMFPILEKSMGLSFTQLGFIAFSLNIVSSVMQPAVGWYTDKRPFPYALPLGLACSMVGIFGLALAPNFWMILISVMIIGFGSAVFHPEGSRVTHMAAGNKRGLAQSIYQVGGNSGQALAQIITALILVPLGQFGAIWFTFVAALAVILLLFISRWYAERLQIHSKIANTSQKKEKKPTVTKAIKLALLILILLVFARSWYGSAISNFYTFYVMDTYGKTIAESQIYIFVFLLFGAIGTFFGGPLADRFGRRTMILISLLGMGPLAIVLPFVGPILAFILLAIIGLILLSSFSVTVVYAQELLPGKIGTMSGLIVGLAFGMGAIGSVALGAFIDIFGLTSTMVTISFLPLLGLLGFLLPKDEELKKWNQQ